MMDAVYEEMYARNRSWLEDQVDGCFHSDARLAANDQRRCLALVARGTWTCPAQQAWGDLRRHVRLHTASAGVEPALHMTFLVVAPWQDGPFADSQVQAVCRALEGWSFEPSTLTVTFDRILPVRTGLVLCGDSPDREAIAQGRDQVRERLAAHGLPLAESRRLDIMHATLWRSCVALPGLSSRLLPLCGQRQQPMLVLHVDRLELVEASWCMQPGTVRCLWTPHQAIGACCPNLIMCAAPRTMLPTTSPKIAAVLFDLDGVLVDSRALHYEALNEALLAEGEQYVITLDEHLAKYDGCPTSAKLARLTAEKGLPQDAHERVWASKQACTARLLAKRIAPAPEHIYSLLHSLRADGKKLFCVSNSIRATLDATLDALRIADCFCATYANDASPYPKPNPGLYLRCFADHGLVPRQCVIVEDSPIGRTAAELSGAHVCAVANPAGVTTACLASSIAAAEAANIASTPVEPRWLSDVQVVVPMAGLGSRFAGYSNLPKPLIDVGGKPMIDWVVNNLGIAGARFVFVTRALPQLQVELEKIGLVVDAPCLTEGPACSVLLAEPHLDPDLPLLIANCDQFLEWDANAFLYQSAGGVDGAVSVFEQPDATDMRWSYARLDPGTGLVAELREKQPISSLASTGIYYWARAGDFCKYARRMIAANDRTNGEFYVAPVYNHAIADGCRIKTVACKRMWGLGVPEDVDRFVREYLRKAKTGGLVQE
jgi:HAD superfamily hydrolase (TIGR01509 family)